MSFYGFKNIFPLSSRQKIGLGFILFAGVCFLIIFILRTYRSNHLFFSKIPDLSEQISEEQIPSKIIIPNLKIDLPVISARASESRWEIFEFAASYLLGSGIPGKEGNVVIYAHNKRHLFGPILWIKEGMEIKIENKRGEIFTYEVKESKKVSPRQIEILLPTKEPILTLYTCTDFADSKRFVVIATLK